MEALIPRLLHHIGLKEWAPFLQSQHQAPLVTGISGYQDITRNCKVPEKTLPAVVLLCPLGADEASITVSFTSSFQTNA